MAGSAATAADPPARVVSINLCTDQLAMMLAAPGQLVSVTHLARDPRLSAMVAEAQDLPVNHARAEEIYLLDPDLVLAGAYTMPATVSMLRRLGIPVAMFEPASSLEDVPAQILAMGAALGRTKAAQAMATAFEARLAALRADGGKRPRAALYAANGYTAGDRSLAGQILQAAGFANVATEYGLSGGGRLPLELLAVSDPDLVIASRPYPGASRAEEILDHPVVQALRARLPDGALRDADWACGTPHVLDAVAGLAAFRQDMTRTGAGEGRDRKAEAGVEGAPDRTPLAGTGDAAPDRIARAEAEDDAAPNRAPLAGSGAAADADRTPPAGSGDVAPDRIPRAEAEDDAAPDRAPLAGSGAAAAPDTSTAAQRGSGAVPARAAPEARQAMARE